MDRGRGKSFWRGIGVSISQIFSHSYPYGWLYNKAFSSLYVMMVLYPIDGSSLLLGQSDMVDILTSLSQHAVAEKVVKLSGACFTFRTVNTNLLNLPLRVILHRSPSRSLLPLSPFPSPVDTCCCLVGSGEGARAHLGRDHPPIIASAGIAAHCCGRSTHHKSEKPPRAIFLHLPHTPVIAIRIRSQHIASY